MKLVALALLAFIVGFQSEAHRLLVVDFTLADPLTLEATAAPWHEAGYRVEYRQFYPHLTRQDLARYRTVLLLAGREPGSPSEALTIGDISILNEWLHRDGVVVLGLRSDNRTKRSEGTLDRWTLNQWLTSLGSGITIDSIPVDASPSPLPHSALDNAGFEPFAAGWNLPLRVRDRSQVLARATGTPAVVAASRVAEGLVVVTSRDLLASAPAERRSAEFLEALARWTRRPAEWAMVTEGVHGPPLQLAGGPSALAVHPPPLVAPSGATLTIVPQPLRSTRDQETVTVPAWISRQGMRVLWTRFSPPSLDADLGFVDLAALNALATVIPAQAITDTIGTRNLWKATAERMQATSIHWFPSIALAALPSEGADEVNRHGDLAPVPCALDSTFWRNALRPTYRTLARLGGARTDVISGVALDLDSAMTIYRSTGFCDADYRVGLGGTGGTLNLDRAEVDRLLATPPTARYDTLLERGWLNAYFDALQAAVAERASALRADLRKTHPDLRFAFHATEPPADWFSLGLLRGFSAPDAPALLWLRQPGGGGRALAQRYRERQIYVLTAVRLAPQEPRTRGGVFGENNGFWLEGGGTATDSLGRVIRRFTK